MIDGQIDTSEQHQKVLDEAIYLGVAQIVRKVVESRAPDRWGLYLRILDKLLDKEIEANENEVRSIALLNRHVRANRPERIYFSFLDFRESLSKGIAGKQFLPYFDKKFVDRYKELEAQKTKYREENPDFFDRVAYFQNEDISKSDITFGVLIANELGLDFDSEFEALAQLEALGFNFEGERGSANSVLTELSNALHTKPLPAGVRTKHVLVSFRSDVERQEIENPAVKEGLSDERADEPMGKKLEETDDVQPIFSANATPELIAERLRAAREAKGWSQIKLAKAMGLKSNRTVQNIEQGNERLSIAQVQKAMEALGLDEI
ncbi:MAG: helix-turn-helix transcriptional regulator [Pseudomonadota bacterium]